MERRGVPKLCHPERRREAPESKDLNLRFPIPIRSDPRRDPSSQRKAWPHEREGLDVKNYWVYILASRTRVLYVGISREIERRIAEHKSGAVPGFTSRYLVRHLVYVERTSDVGAALRREKQIKGWRRSKKLALIESTNPCWNDLAVPAASGKQPLRQD